MPDAPAAATLKYGDSEVDLPHLQASEGNDAVDVSKLLSTTDLVTLRLGFGNTASCKSAITYIDGDAGHPALPRVSRSSSWPRARPSSRSATC